MRLIAMLWMFVALAGNAVAQQFARHALVIGNDGYQHVEKLINSRSDARSIAAALFKEVRRNVERETSGAQVPWESTSLAGFFSFRQVR